jgi:hypothetical protein
MAQGALPFQYEAETAASGVTALGGLPVYLDLIKASGLDVAIRKHVRVAGEQGWLDLQMIVALIVLNLAGGDGLEDLERLEQDAGFVQVMREVERRLLLRAGRCGPAGASLGGAPCRRRCGWPGSMTPQPASHARPAARSSRRWLSRSAPCEPGAARVPPDAPAAGGGDPGHGRHADRNPQTRSTALLQGVQGLPAAELLVGGTGRRAALGVPGRQCPGWLSAASGAEGLSGHRRNYRRNQGLSASAGCQQDLLLYCGEGKVRGDRVQRRCDRGIPQGCPGRDGLAAAVPEGQRYKTDQEFAEVCFVPAGHSRRRADYRFLAIREPLRQLDLADAAQLPFATEEFAASFKLFGLVTNRTLPGDQVIWWLRERCGKSEEVHAVMNWPDAERAVRSQRGVVDDHDPGPQPECRDEAAGAGAGVGRMKALRFSLINLPGRIIRHGRRLIIRVVGETLALLLSARRTILALTPSG